MSSFRICSGGNCSLNIYTSSRDRSNRRNTSHRRSRVAIARRTAKVEIPQALAGAARKVVVVEEPHRRISRETIEEWVQESATAIVKNLPNAPLLIQVIGEADGRKRRLEVEKGASAEMWRSKRRDEIGEGLIVVEELKDGRDSKGVYWKMGEEEEESSKAWGMVVQGRGLECGPVCYLLKTSRVTSSLGCGCTHFCLVRVNDFDRTAERQLADVWLC